MNQRKVQQVEEERNFAEGDEWTRPTACSPIKVGQEEQAWTNSHEEVTERWWLLGTVEECDQVEEK